MDRTLAEAMALAVLRGDDAAAYALADRLAERRDADPAARAAAQRAAREGGLADSFAVYQWPEFQAFCRRLGVMWDLDTIDLTIHLPAGAAVQIEQTYQGKDTTRGRAARNG